MGSSNPFVEVADRYSQVRPGLREPLVTKAIGDIIPLVDTARCFVEAYTPGKVGVSLENWEGVENHVGGIHAAALALLAETASGLVVALNVPDGSAPLLRTMDVSFDRFSRRSVYAEATLMEEEREDVRSRPIGRVEVDVSLQGSEGSTLVTSSLQWAWLPEERLSR